MQEIVGRGVFDVFTDNPANDAAEGAKNLRASLLRALETKAAGIMPVQRYDLRRGEDGDYEERYWSPINAPVLSPSGEVRFIIHRVQDVAEHGRLARRLSVQGWFDNETSLAEKFAFVRRERLAGVAAFPLGYDGGASTDWSGAPLAGARIALVPGA